MVFVAGEAKVDEPLAVEGVGHRLQNLDAPLAVFDEFVVGRQDACDAFLDGERRKRDFYTLDLRRTHIGLTGGTVSLHGNCVQSFLLTQCIKKETRVATTSVFDDYFSGSLVE